MRFDLSLEPHYGAEERLSKRVSRLLARNPSAFTFRGTGVYIIGEGNEVAVVDPGPNLSEHVDCLKRAIGSRKVSHILITHTHRDHSPAAEPLKAWSGAKTYGYGPFVRDDSGVGDESHDKSFVPDVAVTDGMVMQGQGFTIECVFTPGHTANHMCYALPEEKALFTGDHVMGWSTSLVAPPDGNMGDYMRSLEKLIARDDAILYPTHGSPIVQPCPFLRALLTHRRMREAQLANCIAMGDDTLPSMVARLYAGLQPVLAGAASLTVQAHLEHMIEDGRIARDGARYRVL